MQDRPIVVIALLTATVLAVPLVAMQFTDAVDWGWEDVVAGAVLVTSAALVYRSATRHDPTRTQRVTVGVVVLAMVLLVWANLAVGLI